MPSSTRPHLERLKLWSRARAAENAAVADEVAIANLRRMRWVAWAIVPALLLYVLVFWYLRPGDTIEQQAWRHQIGWARLVGAGWMVLVGWCAHHVAKRAVAGPLARGLQTLLPFSCIAMTAVFAMLDQRMTFNVSSFLVGCMFTSLLFLMRPLNALLVHVTAYLMLAVGLWVVGADPTHVLQHRASGMGASIMGVVLALVLWRMNTDFILLQRELRSRNEALVKQQDELVWMATHDSLTGLYSRGELLRLAEGELKRALRQRTDTSVIMVDLDHFKRVNDTYGHLAGDHVLKHTASILSHGVRGTDFVARMGGEEFMVLLPATSLAAAHKLAEKLLRLLRESPALITSERRIAVTASFGVATLPSEQSASVTWLYAAADHALYRAKQEGRDRVLATEPDHSLTPSDFQRMRSNP